MHSNKWGRFALAAATLAAVSWPAAAAADPVKVTYASWGSNEEIQRFIDLADVFNKKHTDVHVEILHITGDYFAALTAQLAAGVGPDAFHVPDSGMARLAKSGLVEDLTPFLNTDASLKLSDFYPPMLGLAKYQGGVYGIPPDQNPIVLYYNADMFADAGLALPADADRKGEWTWDTFRSDAKKLTKLSSGGANETFGFFLSNWWAPIFPFIWEAGGSLWNEAGTASSITDPQAIDALTFLDGMLHADRSTTIAPPANADEMLRTGRLAMIPQGRWVVPTYRTLMQGTQWDVVSMPAGPTGKATGIAGAFSAMNANSAHKQAAWEWLRFFFGPEGQRFRLGGNGNAVPTLRGLDDTVVGAEQIPANAQAFLDGISYGRPYPALEGLQPKLDGPLLAELTALWQGKEAPKTAAEKIKAATDAILQGDGA